MKFLLKILIGIWLGVGVFGGGVFAVDYPIKTNTELGGSSYFNDEIKNIGDNAVKDSYSNRPTVKNAEITNKKNEKVLNESGPTVDKAKSLKELEVKEKAGSLSDSEKRILGNYRNSVGAKECRSGNGIATSVAYDKKKQKPFCYFARSDGYGCEPGTCSDVGENGTVLWIYIDGTENLKGLTLIQSFLSTILGFTLKFGAMLAVLAIVIGGIQISMQGDGEGKAVGKDKIIGGIAALVVLFFAGVILHFINPNYYKWEGEAETTQEESE